MKNRVVLVRHGHGPDDDRIVSHLKLSGYVPDIRHPHAGEKLGEMGADIAGTVIYGGMYNAYDIARHPFLRDEYDWIGRAMEAGLPILGICQGAQMIAHHLGAWVGAPEHGRHEFGYYEVSPTEAGRDFLPEPLHFAQAHYHTFDLPAGAVHLARSESYDNQAFAVGSNVYGVQFHAEQTIEGFRRWQMNNENGHDMPGAQSRAEQTRAMYAHDHAQADWFYGFLAGLFPVRSENAGERATPNPTAVVHGA